MPSSPPPARQHPSLLFPSYPCKSQRVFLRGVYRLGIMKSLRESEAAGVNTRQGILSISHREPCCLGSLFPPPFPLNNQDVKPH